ncbi:MAG: hypothetical protein AAGF47_03750 [Planctomycetota bacterium]
MTIVDLIALLRFSLEASSQIAGLIDRYRGNPEAELTPDEIDAVRGSLAMAEAEYHARMAAAGLVTQRDDGEGEKAHGSESVGLGGEPA